MNTPRFRFGNECYTWFMKDAGAAHANRLAHMIEVTAPPRLPGGEPIHLWMGGLPHPPRLADALKLHDVQLAAIALVLPWNDPQETDDERRKADQVIDLLARFPGAML